MAQTIPFVRMSPSGNDILFGFGLPFLPDVRSVRWLTRISLQERIEEALQRQIPLLNRLWASGISACDLRFVGTSAETGVALGLLCRLQLPPGQSPAYMQQIYQQHALAVQQLYADAGYELVPLTSEGALLRYLIPFRWRMLGELRRHEASLILENAFTEFEVYLPYPWHYTAMTRQPLLEAMLQRQGDCLISCYIEPTRLNAQEQAHISHATSAQTRTLLLQSGPLGRMAYDIYSDYATRLHHPFLVRLSVATTTERTFTLLDRTLRSEVETTNHASARGHIGPEMVVPQQQSEWEDASRCLNELAWLPWGRNKGADLPGTARLRFLMDATEASMSFRVPVVNEQAIVGVPVRPLAPTLLVNQPPPAQAAHTSFPPNMMNTPSAPSSTPMAYGVFNDTDSIAIPFSQHSTSQIQLDGKQMQQPQDAVGKWLGSYYLEALIGEGGFGAVYRARQMPLDRQVAVKVILPKRVEGASKQQQKMVLRFTREAQTVASLNHPFILPLYDYQTNPMPYMVMPYVAGGSLADEIKAHGKRPIAPESILPILQQLAPALDYVHQQRLIHRDLKPHNLLRYPDGRVMLSDFGIVQYVDTLPSLTSSNEGHPYTAAYASPEQLQDLQLDYRSDLFSLGIVLYQLLTSQLPFKNGLQVALAPPPLQTFHVPYPALDAVLAKAMAKEPEQRYDSAVALLQAFQACV